MSTVTYPAALRARAAFLTPAQASTYQRLAAARNSFLELAAARNHPFARSVYIGLRAIASPGRYRIIYSRCR